MELLGTKLGFNSGPLALGAATFVLGPTILTIAVSLAKSLTKAGIKGGLMM